MAIPSDERPSIHGDVVAAVGGHMENEHMLLSKRSSLKENGEWLLADGYNAAPYADISTAGVLGDEVAAVGQNMRDEHMMLPSSECRFNTNVQDDTLDTMAPDLLDGKGAEDIPCQNLAVLQAPGDADVQQATTKERIANRSLGGADDLMDLSSSQTMKLAGRDDKGS
ncbi:hypothetical protein Nepgr_025335 [Nepenthes gracilis]|uniref:Uncharacterized protein n=1 Tax=Nepenthes gracilis TaxID=150966 RepID=A0AAD3T7H9_NEPGR|nr:hypothetical protein Nepgr_025335 [Nepenthes gracilis]